MALPPQKADPGVLLVWPMRSMKGSASKAEFTEVLPVTAVVILMLAPVRVFSRSAPAVNDRHVMLKAAYMEQCSPGQNACTSPDQADADSMAPSRLAECPKEGCVRPLKPQKRVEIRSGRPRTRGLILWLMSGPTETGGGAKILVRSWCDTHRFLPLWRRG